MAFELSGLARVPLLLLQVAEGLGVDRDAAMQAARLTEDDLKDPDRRIGIEKLWAMWRTAIRLTDDPYFGIRVAEAAKIRDLGLVGYTMLHASTLGQALRRLARYSSIISEAASFEVREERDRVRIVVGHNPRFEELRHPTECTVALVVNGSRELTGTRVVPLRACFPFPRPELSDGLRKFFECPVEFQQRHAFVVLTKRDLDLPVTSADKTLEGYLERLAEENLEELEFKGSFREKVRRALWTSLSDGSPSVETIAKALGIGSRTLQRRLKEEGTSYARVLDEFRHAMAVHLLRDRSVAVYEIAFLLGYKESSTFHRAFRRWERTSPHRFRQSA